MIHFFLMNWAGPCPVSCSLFSITGCRQKNQVTFKCYELITLHLASAFSLLVLVSRRLFEPSTSMTRIVGQLLPDTSKVVHQASVVQGITYPSSALPCCISTFCACTAATAAPTTATDQLVDTKILLKSLVYIKYLFPVGLWSIPNPHNNYLSTACEECVGSILAESQQIVNILQESLFDPSRISSWQ